MEQHDLRTKPPKGLCQFASNRAPANDCQAPRAFGEVENRFVGEKASSAKALYRWLHRPCAGGNDSAFESQGPSFNFNGIRPGKLRIAQKHVHAKFRKSLRRIVMAYAGPQLSQPGHYRGKIHFRH